MNEWMNEWMNEMNEWMNEWMKWMNEWNEWMNEMKWMNEWMKWMNEMNEWMNQWINETCRPHLLKVIWTPQCVNMFMWNRALATVLCTFCRQLLQIEARDHGNRPYFATTEATLPEKTQGFAPGSLFKPEFTPFLEAVFNIFLCMSVMLFDLPIQICGSELPDLLHFPTTWWWWWWECCPWQSSVTRKFSDYHHPFGNHY